LPGWLQARRWAWWALALVPACTTTDTYLKRAAPNTQVRSLHVHVADMSIDLGDRARHA